jgi:hypothetical protein
MDQEFAELVRELFEVQEYPDLREFPDGPPEQPYDAAGWTLPYQFDVRVVESRSPLDAVTRAALRALPNADAIVAPSTPANAASLDPAHTEIFRAIGRALSSGGTVRFSDGKYATTGSAGQPTARRIALYKPWTASMDAGWTEWLFDQYGIPFTAITNAELRAGNLASRFDVILFASDGAQTIMNGFAPGTVPPRYEGGVGDAGVRALDEFARAGGTLVFLNSSTAFAIEQLHLPVKNVVAGLDRKDYFASGSILEVTTAPDHPVMAGMPSRAKIFVDRSPVFTTLDGFQGHALAWYQASGSPLLSGYLLGEKYLNGYAAALDVKHGNGRVVLIGFRPQWRGQPMGNFRIVLNAALYGREVAARANPSPIWTAPKTEVEAPARRPRQE